MDIDSDITPANDDNGEDFKWSIYNLVCHGADKPNLDRFLIPEEMEVIFFTFHGGYLQAEHYMDRLFNFIISLNNQNSFMDRFLNLNSDNIGDFEIFQKNDLCYDYELTKFTQDEINTFQNINRQPNYTRFLSLTLHGLSRIYPDLSKFDLKFKYLSDAVEFARKERERRRRNEYIILFACICRA